MQMAKLLFSPFKNAKLYTCYLIAYKRQMDQKIATLESKVARLERQMQILLDAVETSGGGGRVEEKPTVSNSTIGRKGLVFVEVAKGNDEGFYNTSKYLKTALDAAEIQNAEIHVLFSSGPRPDFSKAIPTRDPAIGIVYGPTEIAGSPSNLKWFYLKTDGSFKRIDEGKQENQATVKKIVAYLK